ncbi:PstS family phosphate ABC transporter substrate-binding protein [Humisphaera borealis]|uniref:Phosphate-binding protein n=1 Tax=Humisphaera borealis TaxID=2807512 RepID=A0A7M2WX68_9BACT|nr:PstS family phosphate ABC transporter substrate-binding protein [Humisphaera borealis]QOV89999.1 PstS family phosphate ABC transporter substrate-binding protein [Humisphaera borealis]
MIAKMIRGLVAMAVVSTGSLALAQVKVDPSIPDYKPASGVSGNIKSVGSDTLNNLMTLWAEGFKKAYPSVGIEIEGKGSSTAPPALIEGTAQLGPMSREMKSSEVDQFKAKYGYAPTPVRTAVDSLAVFVHKDNPIKELSLDQVRKIFSVEGKDMKWGDVGLAGEWADKPISLYGRNSASGTYGFFKEVAMGKKDYKPSVKEQAGSSSVVQGIASDKFAMGYSGIGYATADVRAVPLSAKDGAKAFDANAANAYSGDYPLARFLYVYVNAKPGEGPSPIVKEFAKMIFSQQGQQIVVKDGFFPITPEILKEDMAALHIK